MNEEVIYIIQVKFVYIKWVASALLLVFTAHCLVVSYMPAYQGFGNFFFVKHPLQWGFYSPWCSGLIFFLKQGLFVCIFLACVLLVGTMSVLFSVGLSACSA